MPLQTSHIYKIRHLLLVCLVLLGLMPCGVKEALLGTVNVDYVKALNGSKTTAPFNSCQYTQSTDPLLSAVRQSKILKQAEPICFSCARFFLTRSAKTNHRCSPDYSGNSPPKYILYKRLKLDVA
ncbi:hypothetical protein FHS90_004574 [Rufibacter quisquiliarum]|uniref:Uncharacterized protein n=1 Tax=Rufibacter quisquiliarum TaxID=1549639 RepID=A0A839GPD5_9BACT|nr:hypothetical protein [Rufibacter quisquiliarum]